MFNNIGIDLESPTISDISSIFIYNSDVVDFVIPDIEVQQLNNEQLAVFYKIRNYFYKINRESYHLSNNPSPPRILVHGPSGTGKKFVQSYVSSHFTSYPNIAPEKSVVIVAPTAVAALSIDVSTIHSKFLLSKKFITDELSRLLVLNLNSCVLLIVDEISMVSLDILHQVSTRMG